MLSVCQEGLVSVLMVEWSLILSTFSKALTTLNKLNPNKEGFFQSFGHWLLYSEYTPWNEGYQKPSLISSSTFTEFPRWKLRCGFAGADVEPDVHFKHLPAEQHGMAQPEDLSHRQLPPQHQRAGGLTWKSFSYDEYIPPIESTSYHYCRFLFIQ